MKIALFTDGIYPYVIGGMQRHSYYLVKYLAQKGVYVDLYHTSNSDLEINTLACFSDEEKKYIHPIVIPFEDPSNLPGHYLKASYNYSKKIFNAFLERKNVDFIYTKGFTGWYLIKQKASGELYPPIGVNFHGYEMFQKAASFRSWLEQILIFRKPVKYILNHADIVFSYGGKITQLLQRLIGNPNIKIGEIPTGIDEIWLNKAINKTQPMRKLIFVGRFERRKGIEELTRVLKDVIDKYEFQFEFIGPIPQEVQIEHPRIRYWGSITDIEKIKTIFASVDALVCPSHSEGMPNVIVEAMSRGLAVIATDVGAVNKIVNTTNGWLIPKANKHLLKDAITAFLEAPNTNIDYKKEGALKTVAENFLWSDIAEKHISEFKKMIIK